MDFTLDSYYNADLPLGATRIDAVLTISCRPGEGGASPAQKRAIAILLDTSGSMTTHDKMANAKIAARVAIDQIPDDQYFTVISFNAKAKVVVPLQLATPAAKDLAHRGIQQLSSMGSTRMSEALTLARGQFMALPGVIACAQLLTDGENDHNDKDDLEAIVEQSKGIFQCDCRGVGTDWSPAALRMISSSLMGNADAIADASNLAADFQAFLARVMSKQVPDAVLRLWAPKTSKLLMVKQASPELVDLMPLVRQVDARTIEVPLGSWAAESRDYQIAYELVPCGEDEEMLACRPTLVYPRDGVEQKVVGRNVAVTWTADAERTARINREVAHYSGQEELAESIRRGLEAKARGDDNAATVLLGRAAQLAQGSGNDEVTRRLAKVVTIDDAANATVRLKREDKGADLELEMGGTRTVRRGSRTTTPSA